MSNPQNTPHIHPTAIVSADAKLAEGVRVGPYSIIGPHVEIGADTEIQSHVVVSGRTKIGKRNRIFPFAAVGGEPQDLKFSQEESLLEIGDDNIIREYVTLQPGTSGGGMITSIGDGNLFMACTHVGHDCRIGNRNIMANNSALSGHVEVRSFVTIGGFSGIHQFVRLGSYSFIGGGSMVVQDVPPFCLAQGDRAQLVGLNLVGLKRHGFIQESIRDLKRAYRELFLRPGRRGEKIQALRGMLVKTTSASSTTASTTAFSAAESAENKRVVEFLDFIESSARGIASARSEQVARSEGTTQSEEVNPKNNEERA